MTWSPVQFKIVARRSEKAKCAPLYQQFPQRCLVNSSSVCLIDSGPLVSLTEALFPRLSSRQSMVWRHWLCARRVVNISDLLRHKPFVMVALPASLSVRSFPFTPACLEQSFSRWVSNTDTCRSGLPIPLVIFCGKLIESEGDGTCGLTRILRQSSEGRWWLLPPGGWDY